MIEANPFLLAFAILALVAAALHGKTQNHWRFAAMLATCAVACWLLLFAALDWRDAQWTKLLESTPNPSDEFLEQFNSDGASNTFILLFGLPASLLYVSFCFGVSRGIRRLCHRADA